MKKSTLLGGLAIIAILIVGGFTYAHYNAKNQEASVFNLSKTAMVVSSQKTVVTPDITVITSDACGSANGGTFTSAPTTNLCSPGTASTPVATSTGWSWTCSGNGSPVSCAASSCPSGDIIFQIPGQAPQCMPKPVVGKIIPVRRLVDVCPNISGIQLTVPAGDQIVNGQCVPIPATCTPKIYVMGGHDASTIFADAYSFDGTNWSQQTTVPWVAREYASAVFFQNKLWVMGGTNNSGPLNDVWSYDGTTWTQHANTPWSPRFRFGAVVYNNELWVMGGRTGINGNGTSVDDVWSFDGTTWTQHANAPWSARNGFSTLVYNNKIYIMGGTPNGAPLNDIWSFDGTTWVQQANAPWSTRFVFGLTTLNNNLWIIGGDESADFNPEIVFGYDVWSSSNGTAWIQKTNAPWVKIISASPVDTGGTFGRGEFQLNVLNNKIWLMGGSYTDIEYAALKENFFNDVWSFDGTSWSQQTNAPWIARDGYASTVACLPSSTSGSLPNQGSNTSKSLIPSSNSDNIILSKSADMDGDE